MESSTNVFINYLPKNILTEGLQELCERYGEIKSAKVIIDTLTGDSKCFGFVRFKSRQSAEMCIADLNGAKWGEKRLIARLSPSKENVGMPSRTIKVKSLPLSYDKVKIGTIFQEYGEILGIHLKVDPQTKKFKGKAYITYSTIKEAKRALKNKNSKTLEEGCFSLLIQYSKREFIEDGKVSYGIVIKKPNSDCQTQDGEYDGSFSSSYYSSPSSNSNKGLSSESPSPNSRKDSNDMENFDRANENFFFDEIREELLKE